MDLITANVVVAARSFNPSILTQLWLVRNNIVAEDEFKSGCLFAEGISQVQTPRLMLVALPERLQVSPLDPTDDVVVRDAVTKIVAALPHTPYTALGLNFIWHYTPETESIAEMTRRLFSHSDRPPYSEFAGDDAHFGAYMSKRYGKMRLKLDIKPIGVGSADGQTQHRLQFSYNFHLALDAKAVGEISNALDQWKQALDMTASITTETCRVQK